MPEGGKEEKNKKRQVELQGTTSAFLYFSFVSIFFPGSAFSFSSSAPPTLEVKIGGKEERMKEEEEEEEEALFLFFFLLSLSFPARVGHLSDKDFLPLSHKKRRIRPKKTLS